MFNRGDMAQQLFLNFLLAQATALFQYVVPTVPYAQVSAAIKAATGATNLSSFDAAS